MKNKKKTNLENILLDGTKLPWHLDRVNAWLNGERIAPITIDCALTRACNYNCVYCYGKLQQNKIRPLTRDIIFRFLDDIAEIGVRGLSFVSDGESTCSPHLYESILRGKRNGLSIGLGTNGSLLKGEELEKVLGSLDYLRFNFSAADSEEYRKIHGCEKGDYEKVISNIKLAVELKKRERIDTTIGLQMVLMPAFKNQIIPLAKLGKELGVDYLIIKHCSDDENSSLRMDYSKYFDIIDILKEAEKMSTEDYLVRIKWSKILSMGERDYSRCYGPAFIMQISGSGLVAPCGMLFNERYKKYHIGNIAETPFKEIWKSQRYGEVLDLISSDKFDARTMCGKLCLQHNVNQYLTALKNKTVTPCKPNGPKPAHINFI